MSMYKRGTAVVAGVVLLAACGSDDGEGTDEIAAATIVEQDDGATVRVGRADWSTGYFQAAVYAALLDELGYSVADPSRNEWPVAEAYREMAAGTFDFWANGWYSQHFTHHQKERDDGTLVGDHLVVIGNQMPAGGVDGLLVTRSVADEYGITSLDQVNDDPELVALFDADGDGLGEVHGCPDNWTCDDIVQELLDFNGWTNLEQVKAGYPGMIATSMDRVEAGEPVIQYSWSPSAYLTVLVPGENVYWLSLGAHEFVLDGSTPGGFDFSYAEPARLGSACTDDPCWLGWENSDIKVTANAAFAAANPVAVALFEVVEMPVADVIAQNVRYDAGENTEADVQRHAAEWIEANRPLVDEWLTTARAAG